MSSGVFRGVRQQVTSPNNVSTANKDVLDDDNGAIVVRERYEKRLTDALVTKSSVGPYLNDDGTPFTDENRFHYTYNGRFLFVADGSMFELGRTVDSKGLTRDPVLCQDDQLHHPYIFLLLLYNYLLLLQT